MTDGNGIYLLDRRPYRVIATGPVPRSAIVVVNSTIGVLGLRQFSTPHFAVATIGTEDFSSTLISAYFQFTVETEK